MFLLVTGGCGSGKSWIAQEFAKKTDPDTSVVVLDCVAEFLAGKWEEEGGSALTVEALAEKTVREILHLSSQTDHFIVVSNEVFSDVPGTDEQRKFTDCLGRINQALAKRADLFVEVVYGIPIWRKKAEK